MTRILDLVWITGLARKLRSLTKKRPGWLRRRRPGRALGRIDNGRLTPFRRHLITNLVVGLGIALVLHALHHGAYLRSLDDLAMDWAMGIHRGTAPPGEPVPVAFVEIDEASYLAWGEPLMTPRDRLAALLAHAIAGRPAVIVVDIDLARPGGNGDQALADVLAPYAGAGAGDDLPPIIFARTQRPALPGEEHTLPRERPSFLDPLVAAAPRLHWGAPVFDLDDDGKVRRWHLWKAVCGADGQPRVRPSIQLLVKSLLDGIQGQRERLHDALGQLTPEDCSGTAEGPPGQAAGNLDDHAGTTDRTAVTLGVERIDLAPHDIERRILYRMPWRLKKGEGRPLVALKGERVPLLSVRPAAGIAAARAADPSWLRDHLVLIGGSYADSRDLYQTPIGLMPGALIIANAVLSLDVHGQLRAPGLVETLLLEAALIALMSYLFTRFDSFWGSLGSAAAVILLLLPLSLWAFRWGYWLSFAVPLLAVQIHEMAAELEEALAHRQTAEDRHD